MQLFLKASQQIGIVVCRLGVLRQPGLGGLFLQAWQLRLAQLLHPQLAGDDIHTQFLEIGQVHLVHFVHHGNVLGQHAPMLVQRRADLVHIHLGLVVLRFQLRNAALPLFEQAAQPLFLSGIVKPLELNDQIREHISHFAQILCAHLIERLVGKIGDVLLRGRAVIHHLGGIADVDLLGKAAHCGLLLR